MNVTKERYLGCLIGLATGDALGAPYEGGFLERGLWKVIGRTRSGTARWTDDTQMALDVAESILSNGSLSQDELAIQFASSYQWTRGYGPGTARILRRIRRGQHWSKAAQSVYPEGSFGNGAAMRAPVLALAFPSDSDQLIWAAKDSAVVTHSHSQGIEGAVVIAVATKALLTGRPAPEVVSFVKERCRSFGMIDRVAIAASWLLASSTPSPNEVVRSLGNGTTAVTSCVTALYIALRHLENKFEQMMEFIIACGGDVDTIGSMAGALWGSANGFTSLPDVPLEAKARLENTASRLYAFAVPPESEQVQV